jgi:hypothetical protein
MLCSLFRGGRRVERRACGVCLCDFQNRRLLGFFIFLFFYFLEQRKKFRRDHWCWCVCVVCVCEEEEKIPRSSHPPSLTRLVPFF